MNINNENIISTPKVSVIIPVYNTELYLREALDSICNQSLKELEIIIINDGSTDNSQQIIDEYAKKDSRIITHRQPNQGQGVARNVGFSISNGKYIYYMDSDDILSKDTLEECYSICEKNQLDFILFDAESFGNNNKGFNYCRKGIIEENIIWNGHQLLNKELKKRCYLVSVCLGLYNKQFLLDSFSGFPPGIIHEDHLFVFQTMIQAKRILYTSTPYFKRRVREYSTMTNHFSIKNIDGYCVVCSQICNWSKANEEWKETVNLYLKETLNSVVWLGHSMTFLEKLETFFRFQRIGLSQYVSFKNWIKFWIKRERK